MKLIQLTKGYWAQVDDEDYEKVNKLKWFSQVTRRYVYAAHTLYHDGPVIYLHRFVLSAPKGVFVDHVDHQTLNCQKNNLRLCSNRQNQWNGFTPQKRSLICSKYKGVTPRGKKWQATIRINGKKTNLGLFLIEWDAAEAYNKAAQEFRGEFANLNKKLLN